MIAKGKIVGIFTTLIIALVILSVSVLKSTASPHRTYAYSPMVLSEKVESQKIKAVDYSLPYEGKINPDSPFWYPKVIRDKAWYLLTFNSSKKTELNLLFADKRLSSSLELFKDNKPDLGFATLTKAEKYLEKAIPENANDPEYLKKLATASLKHKEIIEIEILPITPEDLRPEVIKVGNSTIEVYKKVKDLMMSIGLVPPQNPFETN